MNSYNNNLKASIVLLLNIILYKLMIINKNLNDNYHKNIENNKFLTI